MILKAILVKCNIDLTYIEFFNDLEDVKKNSCKETHCFKGKHSENESGNVESVDLNM